MKRRRTSAIIVSVFSLTFLTVVTAHADYEIDWYTIDGGGGTSSGGNYVLSGTIGQADAAESQGSNFIVAGGFWSGGIFCLVDMEHFARFAEYWLMTGTDLPADLYDDGGNIVNLDDLDAFLDWWLCVCPYDWPLK